MSKKIYVIWFIILVLPPIIIRLMTESGNLILPEDIAMLLTVITKVGIIIFTILYALTIKIDRLFSFILGFITLLPFGVWISFIILLTKGAGNKSILSNTPDSIGALSSEKIKLFRYIILILLIILGLAFYWFQLRPAQIKKECYTITSYKPVGSNIFDQIVDGKNHNPYYESKDGYTDCLRVHGL